MRQIKTGSSDKSVDLYIIDSTDGTPETGVTYDESGIDLKYRREGAVVQSITEQTLASLSTAHADGGFLEIGNGSYRFDVPDAAWASGATKVTIFGTITGMVVLPVEVQLVAHDLNDNIRLGLTALPPAAANAAGGLVISSAGGLDIDTKLANTNEVTAARMATLTDWIDAGRLDTILDGIKSVTDSLPDSGALTTLITHLTDIKGTSFAKDTHSLTDIITDVTGLDGDAMRGTNSANTVVPDAAGVAPTVDEIVDQVWDELKESHVAAGSFGEEEQAHALTTDIPTVTEIQTEMEENGASLLDTIRDDLANGTDGLGALKTLIDTVNTDLSNGTDGLGALKTLIDVMSGNVDDIEADLANGTDGLGALKTLIDNQFTTVLTESYASDGSTATVAELLYMLWSILNSLKFVGAVGTARKLDGSTTAMSFAIDDADNPTDINRSA